MNRFRLRGEIPVLSPVSHDVFVPYDVGGHASGARLAAAAMDATGVVNEPVRLGSVLSELAALYGLADTGPAEESAAVGVAVCLPMRSFELPTGGLLPLLV
jgi:hypothetical protein